LYFLKVSPTIFRDLQNSLIPTLSSGQNSQIIYCSTSFGKNHYYNLFVGALATVMKLDGQNGIIPLEFTYKDIPERNTIEWEKEQIQKLGKEGHAQENMSKFLSVSGTLINGLFLSQIQEKIPIEDEYIIDSLNEYANYVSIYETPQENEIYIIVVDPNESNGELQDIKSKSKPNAMGIQIIKVTNIDLGWEQVATVYIPGESPVHYLELAPISYLLAKYYNNAVLFIENNISGKEIGNKIFTDYLYDKVFSEKENIFGYRLKQNKLMLCKMLKIMLENRLLKIYDNLTILQLKSFIKRGKSYSAMAGYEDDLITPLVGAMILLLLDANQVETYFPEGFDIPNKLTILEEIYKLNPNKTEQYDTMCDLIVKIENQESVFTDPEELQRYKESKEALLSIKFPAK
jgi:hypothetical protein